MGKSKTLLKNLRAFKRSVGKQYPVSTMLLFGSRAYGKPSKGSDIDLIIVSPKFGKMDFFKRGARMYDYWALEEPVDFLCYSPKEFNKLKYQVSIVSEALRHGIKV